MTPWRAARYAVLDFESTGTAPRRDEVLQVGLVTAHGAAVQLGSAWASWVRPTRPFSEAAVRVHGLSYAALQDAPPLAEVRPQLARRLHGHVLVAHYAPMEVGFLKRWNLRPREVLDTLELALRLDGQRVETARRERYTLNALAQRFGVTVYGEHDALADALMTAQIFVALASSLEEQRAVTTVRDLSRLSGSRWFSGFW